MAMKTKVWNLAGVVLAIGVAVCLVTYAQKGVRKADENELKVSIDQVPSAVKTALLKEAQGGTIKEIELGSENGKTIYEADVDIANADNVGYLD
jgi:uncharacterized membrane protein YkoI